MSNRDTSFAYLPDADTIQIVVDALPDISIQNIVKTLPRYEMAVRFVDEDGRPINVSSVSITRSSPNLIFNRFEIVDSTDPSLWKTVIAGGAQDDAGVCEIEIVAVNGLTQQSRLAVAVADEGVDDGLEFAFCVNVNGSSVLFNAKNGGVLFPLQMSQPA